MRLWAEFRHESWNRPPVFEYLRRLDLGYCAVDEPELPGLMPGTAAATTDTGYVRFHGRNAKTWNIRSEKSSERFDWMYSEAELGEWVEELGRLAREADDVYAMFNNNRDDFAPRSAAILRGLLDRAGVPVRGGLEPPPARPTLF